MMGKKKEITCRRLLMFFFCCMMFFSRPAMESQAATHTETNGVRYTFEISINGGDRAVITSVYVPGSVSSLTIPGTVIDSSTRRSYPVVGIQGTSSGYNYVGAFKNSGGKPVSITLPDSVCEIYQQAFDDLPNLQTLSLNGDGIVIGYEAFKGCKNLKVTFRGSGAVKYISGYAFETGNSNCLDYNIIKNRVDKNSWIGYDATWNNEAEWEALVNSLTPFSVSVADDSNRDWEPTFEPLNAANGYPDSKQITSNATATNDYNAWIRKAARWVDSNEEKAEIRLDVAYNPMSAKSSNDMVFVLDVSASMYYGYNLIPGSNYSRQFQTFDQVRSVGKALLDINESGKDFNRVAATTFGDDYLGNGTAARGTTRSAAGATNGFFTNYASFVKWLDRENYLFPANTGYSLGLEEAVTLFRNRSATSRTPSVVFLSDGEPNRGTTGTFPGTSKSGYGGPSTRTLSNLGVTRYSILLGEQSTNALNAVTLVAGEPGTSDDSTRTYASPDAATLQQAFQAILVQMTENLSLSLSDTAGEYFDVKAIPTASGGSVSLSGVSTSWDFSGTSPRQVYTLIIIQDLKRNSNDNNAFFYGNMETNLDNAVLEDAAIGSILEVGSPALSRAYGEVTIRVHVDHGLAKRSDGEWWSEISTTITKTGTYEAVYKGDTGAILQSISVAAEGETPVPVSIEPPNDESYTLEDIRCNYDIWVYYVYPPAADGTWSYWAEVEGGTFNGGGDELFEEDIPLFVDGKETSRLVVYYPDEGYELKYISVGTVYEGYESERRLDAEELERHRHNYLFSEPKSGWTYFIRVVYKKIPKTTGDEDERTWGDYRR